MFFFIFCSFGANNNNIQLRARIILHASTILHVYIILHTTHQARDDATSPTTTHTINGTRHPTSTVWRHSPRDGWRCGVARRDSRQNPRANRCRGSASARFPAKNAREDHPSYCVSSSSACSEARKAGGKGSVSSPDWWCGFNAPKRGRGDVARMGWRELRGWRTTEEGGTRSGADCR